LPRPARPMPGSYRNSRPRSARWRPPCRRRRDWRGNNASQQAAAERRVGDGEMPNPDCLARFGRFLAASSGNSPAPPRSDRPRALGGAARDALRTARWAPCHADQPAHLADRLLDRRAGVDPVLVVQVDDLHRPLQAGTQLAAHIPADR
jgi:hypothetical protein